MGGFLGDVFNERGEKETQWEKSPSRIGAGVLIRDSPATVYPKTSAKMLPI
jgi:hypothetical protein